jgi:hypothetical protein
VLQLMVAAGWSDGSPSVRSSASSGSGILAMVASEKTRRHSNCHSSCCSSSWLPTSRVMAASFGKIPTTLVRLLISLFRRSSGVTVQRGGSSRPLALDKTQAAALISARDSLRCFLHLLASAILIGRRHRLRCGRYWSS